MSLSHYHIQFHTRSRKSGLQLLQRVNRILHRTPKQTLIKTKSRFCWFIVANCSFILGDVTESIYFQGGRHRVETHGEAHLGISGGAAGLVRGLVCHNTCSHVGSCGG